MDTASSLSRVRAIDGLPEQLAGDGNLSTQLRVIADTITNVLQCRGLAIYAISPSSSDEQEILEPAACSGLTEPEHPHQHDLVQRVSASWLRDAPNPATRVSSGGATIVPIVYRRECVGAIAIDHGDEGLPTDGRSLDLGNLVGLAALAIADHRLTVEGRRLVGDLRAIKGLGQAVGTASDSGDTLEVIFTACAEVLEFDTASLFVLEDGGNTLRLARSRHLALESTVNCRFKVGEGVVGWVVGNNRPAIVPDTLRDVRFVYGGTQRRRSHSLLVVPLRIQSQVIAALSFSRHRPDAFSRRDLELAEVVAAYAAQALEHSRLAKAAAEVETLRQGAELLAGVSHDIRAPLTLIKVVVELLKHQLPDADDRQSELLRTITRATNQLSGLVNAVIETSRLDTSLTRLELEPVPVTSLAEVAFATLSWRATACHRLQADVPTDLTVAGDASQLQRLLTNLVDNALKYSPDGGIVAIKAHRDEDEAVIRVVDQGIGIPRDKLPLIFDKFRRVANEIASHDSYGLGLYISRRIVEAHGGSISASSEPGVGSEFTVRLPALPAELAAPTRLAVRDSVLADRV